MALTILLNHILHIGDDDILGWSVTGWILSSGPHLTSVETSRCKSAHTILPQLQWS